MVGTVPAYEVLGRHERDFEEIAAEEWPAAVDVHARDGVDFMTIHAGPTRELARRLRRSERIMNIVSRGGALLFAWMELTGEENPYYAPFDEVLEICAEYDVTLSLGDAGRPGCTRDATDAVQVAELLTLGDLAKRLCHGASLYVLGPLVADVAPGYDHITSAIGGALATAAGADFLCYVTPAEHLRPPAADDVREGIVAVRSPCTRPTWSRAYRAPASGTIA